MARASNGMPMPLPFPRESTFDDYGMEAYCWIGTYMPRSNFSCHLSKTIKEIRSCSSWGPSPQHSWAAAVSLLTTRCAPISPSVQVAICCDRPFAATLSHLNPPCCRWLSNMCQLTHYYICLRCEAYLSQDTVVTPWPASHDRPGLKAGSLTNSSR